MGEKLGKIFKKQLEDIGVKFRMNAGVGSAEPSTSDPTHVGAITLEGGERLEADLVILGVGVTPATGYLSNSGVGLERDGSVRVDDFWRIKGVDDAYAVGQFASIEFQGVSKEVERMAVLIYHRRYRNLPLSRPRCFARQPRPRRALECRPRCRSPSRCTYCGR